MWKLTALLMLGLCLGAQAQSRNVETHRVFGPEHPGPYKHPASITELANGDLYIAYYGGQGEYEEATAVYGARLPQGETQWDEPRVIASTPFHGVGNAVVWQAPDERVWLFYVNRYGPTWSNARVKAKISNDGAETWSDSFMINFEEGTMAQGKPLVLNSGEYLVPMYYETGEDINRTASDTVSYFLRFNPETHEWTESSRIRSTMGNLQPQPVQLSDDHLIAYIRRGGDFEPTDHSYLLRAESHDGGHTWSEAVETDFRSPNAPCAFIKLQNGHLLIAWNDDFNERTPLRVAISTDDGESFAYSRSIGGGDNTFAYPYAIQTQDGKIHIVYTTNIRTTIMHAVFDEEAITQWPQGR